MYRWYPWNAKPYLASSTDEKAVLSYNVYVLSATEWNGEESALIIMNVRKQHFLEEPPTAFQLTSTQPLFQRTSTWEWIWNNASRQNPWYVHLLSFINKDLKIPSVYKEIWLSSFYHRDITARASK